MKNGSSLPSAEDIKQLQIQTITKLKKDILLLDGSMSELSKRSGLNRQTICNTMDNKVKPNKEVITAAKKYLAFLKDINMKIV